jgi:hypothetical protein
MVHVIVILAHVIDIGDHLEVIVVNVKRRVVILFMAGCEWR